MAKTGKLSEMRVSRLGSALEVLPALRSGFSERKLRRPERMERRRGGNGIQEDYGGTNMITQSAIDNVIGVNLGDLLVCHDLSQSPEATCKGLERVQCDYLENMRRQDPDRRDAD